jgi:pimeloyl-ACP methyl ester carboxylesterase
MTEQIRRRDILAASGGLMLAACGSTEKPGAAATPGVGPSIVNDAYASQQDKLYAARGLSNKSRDVRMKQPGLRIRVRETGSGAPIVLLHGNGAGAHWLPLIAPDLPGFGLSDPFLYDGVDMRAFGSACVKAVFDGMDLKRASLVGNWLGGYWAMCFAADYPERVERLILAGGPAGGAETPAMSVQDIEVRVAEARQGGRAGLARVMANTQRMPEDLLSLLELGRGLPGTKETERSIWRATATNKLTFGLRPEMPRIIAPTLLLWGDQDRVDPPGGGSARAMLAALPDARASIVPDAGHLVWIDRPDECARQIIQFIA